jgi:5-(carboxyamino)imidazole ribonucleotide synthase
VNEEIKSPSIDEVGDGADHAKRGYFARHRGHEAGYLVRTDPRYVSRVSIVGSHPPERSFPIVGVVGAGQLARMMQAPAIALGVTLRVLADTATDSAAQVIPSPTVGDFRDIDVLRRFAAGVDVLTFDHEHVPTELVSALLAEGFRVHPGASALVLAQNKIAMREKMEELGLPSPRWSAVTSRSELDRFADAFGVEEVVIKTPTGGYDGKGVWVMNPKSTEFDELLTKRSILLVEEKVSFDREISVLIARSPHGQASVWPVTETVQIDGICRQTITPAPGLSDELAITAQRMALEIASACDVVGIMAVEIFQRGSDLFINELAMRPHNSGHWTIDGSITSQFEQHLRAILDLPLGATGMNARFAVMANVLGGEKGEMYRPYLHLFARDPGLKIHQYGKEVRPGRKVGHVTVTGDDLTELQERAEHAADYLTGVIDE